MVVASRVVVCCFVLLVPTPLVYRVPRVSPGVTAPKLRLLPSLATPVPPSSLQTTPEVPVLLSEVQSGVQHLLGQSPSERCVLLCFISTDAGGI